MLLLALQKTIIDSIVSFKSCKGKNYKKYIFIENFDLLLNFFKSWMKIGNWKNLQPLLVV